MPRTPPNPELSASPLPFAPRPSPTHTLPQPTKPPSADESIVHASGKLEVLDRMLGKLKARGHRVVLFSQVGWLPARGKTNVAAMARREAPAGAQPSRCDGSTVPVLHHRLRCLAPSRSLAVQHPAGHTGGLPWPAGLQVLPPGRVHQPSAAHDRHQGAAWAAPPRTCWRPAGPAHPALAVCARGMNRRPLSPSDGNGARGGCRPHRGAGVRPLSPCLFGATASAGGCCTICTLCASQLLGLHPTPPHHHPPTTTHPPPPTHHQHTHTHTHTTATSPTATPRSSSTAQAAMCLSTCSTRAPAGWELICRAPTPWCCSTRVRSCGSRPGAGCSQAPGCSGACRGAV